MLTSISSDSLSFSPLVHGPPAASHPLIDHPLVIPDRGEAADGVEAITVSIARPGHIDQSGDIFE